MTRSIKEMIEAGLTVTTYNGRILRNAGMTGQQLHEQHRKVYPDRAANGIKGIVMTARKRGLYR